MQIFNSFLMQNKSCSNFYRFMHCHFEWHMAAGMALVLQIGESSDMKNPPENFPTCNNFKPDIDRAFLDANRITL